MVRVAGPKPLQDAAGLKLAGETGVGQVHRFQDRQRGEALHLGVSRIGGREAAHRRLIGPGAGRMVLVRVAVVNLQGGDQPSLPRACRTSGQRLADVSLPGHQRVVVGRPRERVAAHGHRSAPPGDGAARVGGGHLAECVLRAVEVVQAGDRRLERRLHRRAAGGRERHAAEPRHVARPGGWAGQGGQQQREDQAALNAGWHRCAFWFGLGHQQVARAVRSWNLNRRCNIAMTRMFMPTSLCPDTGGRRQRGCDEPAPDPAVPKLQGSPVAARNGFIGTGPLTASLAGPIPML